MEATKRTLFEGNLLYLAAMPTTEIILSEPVYNLGVEADIVKVKTGYARNFLLPTGKALEVTPATLRRVNLLKAKRAEREAREMNEAQDVARRIGKVKLDLELETGETGKAFGSITAADIADHLRKQLGGTFEIDRHRIHLERPIKEAGKHEITIKLHHDVNATLTVNVTAKGSPAIVEGDATAPTEEEKAGSYKAKAKAKHKAKE